MTLVKLYAMLNLARNQCLHRYKKIESRHVHRYFHQFDHLVFFQGVLHRVCKQDGTKYHQFILPIEFRAQVMD